MFPQPILLKLWRFCRKIICRKTNVMIFLDFLNFLVSVFPVLARNWDILPIN